MCAQPFFETSVSQFIKPPFHCLDLGSEQAVSRLARYEGLPKPPDELAKNGDYWHYSNTKIVIADLKDRRLPPLVPGEFARRAESKALTNGKDKDVLLRLQADVATTVLGTVREMNFAGLEWDDEDAALLVEAMRLCVQLTSLDVRRNDNICGEGASQLSAAVVSNLTIVVFNGMPIKEMRTNSLTELDLSQKEIGVVGSMVVVGLLQVMASLTSVR